MGLLTETIRRLQDIGKSGREYMIFWLGVRQEKSIKIKEVYTPLQITSRISIQIPQRGMQGLFKRLREKRYILAAQVHIHPLEAYHSEADDYLAILRHEGALSFVLPYFGLRTTPTTFFEDAVCYAHTKSGNWEKVDGRKYTSLGK